MMMKTTIALGGLLAVITLVGCNVGEAPSGSADAVKDQYNAMKPEDKIKFLQGSPIPAAEKQKRIDEIKKQAGITGDTPAAPIGGPPQHG